ncbi:MAG TPA: hypothetical protein VMW86_10420, partial [Dehalococcoidales bacterium]|nr:hypothetical protein [Dehalococcoidales bacterium]
MIAMFFLLQRNSYNLLDKACVIHSGGGCLAGSAGVRGYIWVGVYLDNVQPPFPVHTHIHPGV